MIASSVGAPGANAIVCLTSRRAAAMCFAKCSATRGAAACAPPYRPPSINDHCRLLAKMAEPFELLETIRWTPDGGFFLLDRHLRRIEHSAAYFHYQCSTPRLRSHIE